MVSLNPRNESQIFTYALRERLLILDAEFQIIAASRSYYEAFHVDPEHTIGQPLHEASGGQWNIPALQKFLDDLPNVDGQFNEFEVSGEFAGQGLRKLCLIARRLRDFEMHPGMILLSIEDITRRGAAESNLRVSEVRYRRLFEAAHDGILILDAHSGRVVDVNPFMIELLKYPRENFLGKELWELGFFHDAEANKNAMKTLRATGSIRYEDLPLQDRDGGQIPVEFVSNVYREGDRDVIQCNIRDISARKRFEREREELLASEQSARREAEAATRAKDVFLATLSHELRTPLNAILGWVQILRQGNCNPEDVTEAVDVIERSGKAQAQLIEDVLDISRIVSGKMHLDCHVCDLSDIIASTVKIVEGMADAKQIQMETDVDLQAGHISCDPIRIQQIIWNLMSNAIKFTPSRGKVRIRLASEGSSTIIQVSDNGLGISPEFLPHAFERFRQADGSTRRMFGGLGLGLSIVRHLVELHGGTVHVESAGESRGSTFTVVLPMRTTCEETSFPKSGKPEQSVLERGTAIVSLDGVRILIVDDEADARNLLTKALTDAGALVEAAGSVQQAIDLFATVRPHVLVSDLAMPGQDGFDLINQVRKEYKAKDLPAIALTAFAHKDDRRRALLAGYQMHISKPVDLGELSAVIASLAGRTG